MIIGVFLLIGCLLVAVFVIYTLNSQKQGTEKFNKATNNKLGIVQYELNKIESKLSTNSLSLD